MYGLALSIVGVPVKQSRPPSAVKRIKACADARLVDLKAQRLCTYFDSSRRRTVRTMGDCGNRAGAEAYNKVNGRVSLEWGKGSDQAIVKMRAFELLPRSEY